MLVEPHPGDAAVPESPVLHRSPWDALAGVLAAAVALATGELATGADDAGVSLVSAVGDEVIDGLAGALAGPAIALFGTNDKPALVVGIVLVSLAVGAALGTAARRRRWLPAVAFAAFGVAGGWAYQQAPLTEPAVGWAAATFGAGAGWASLWVLLGLAPRVVAHPRPPELAPTDGVATPGGVAVAPRSAGPGLAVADRRLFLLTAGLLGVGAAGAAVASRRLRGPDALAEVRRSIVLPDAEPLTTVPPAQPFAAEGLSPYVTPIDDFYRIDTALTIPRVDPTSWSLQIDGLVDAPFTLTYDELLGLRAVEVPVTLQCVSNEVGGDLVGTAVWQGVPLVELLDRAGVRDGATQVLGRSVDGFTAGFPTALARDGRTAVVAYAMNGELLPPRHGFPARLVVAGLYGYVSATKWLERIELTRWEDVDGYWIPRGWAKEGPIKTASRIDVPRPGARLTAGPQPVAGVAWAPGRGIRAVEVQVDDGPWLPCELGRVASDETWVQWLLRWDATPGEHIVTVRATDGAGEVQTAEVAPPAPDGSTGRHARRVFVEA